MYLGVKVQNCMMLESVKKNPELIQHFFDKCLSFLRTSCLELKKRLGLELISNSSTNGTCVTFKPGNTMLSHMTSSKLYPNTNTIGVDDNLKF